MYTQCPECQTTFALSAEQLEVRGGVVRCGQCEAVFRADQHLFKKLPAKTPTPALQPATAPSVPEPITLERPQIKPENAAPPRKPIRLPTIAELLTGKPRSRTRPFFWLLGNLLVLALLMGQLVYFYSNELAGKPVPNPWILKACQHLGCEILPQQDVGLIELTNTRVAPHPKYANVLRVRATLINRATYAQPYPLMEVGLSNSRGEVVGRRTFPPEKYLIKSQGTDNTMIPNVIVRARLVFTNPNPKADGYEIRLLADLESISSQQ